MTLGTMDRDANGLLARKRILFVDDDPAILAGLRNLLYKDSMRWDMVFALGGEDALGETRKQPFDVVVSDQGMPGIDGATLLSTINEEHPKTALIMLSGYVDTAPSLCTLPTLLVLTKPCDTATLREAIERGIDQPCWLIASKALQRPDLEHRRQ